MKKMYIAPEVEVLDVMVEQGFAGSANSQINPPSDVDDDL